MLVHGAVTVGQVEGVLRVPVGPSEVADVVELDRRVAHSTAQPDVAGDRHFDFHLVAQWLRGAERRHPARRERRFRAGDRVVGDERAQVPASHRDASPEPRHDQRGLLRHPRLLVREPVDQRERRRQRPGVLSVGLHRPGRPVGGVGSEPARRRRRRGPAQQPCAQGDLHIVPFAHHALVGSVRPHRAVGNGIARIGRESRRGDLFARRAHERRVLVDQRDDEAPRRVDLFGPRGVVAPRLLLPFQCGRRFERPGGELVVGLVEERGYGELRARARVVGQIQVDRGARQARRRVLEIVRTRRAEPLPPALHENAAALAERRGEHHARLRRLDLGVGGVLFGHAGAQREELRQLQRQRFVERRARRALLVVAERFETGPGLVQHAPTRKAEGPRGVAGQARLLELDGRTQHQIDRLAGEGVDLAHEGAIPLFERGDAVAPRDQLRDPEAPRPVGVSHGRRRERVRRHANEQDLHPGQNVAQGVSHRAGERLRIGGLGRDGKPRHQDEQERSEDGGGRPLACRGHRLPRSLGWVPKSSPDAGFLSTSCITIR